MEKKDHFIVFLVKSVSCTHQGLGDAKQHCAGKTHQKNAAAIAQSHKITSTKPVNDDKQICKEVVHTNFIVQYEMSFLTADHLGLLYHVMFPDSNIAKNFRCRRSKTTRILNNALYPKIKSDLVEYMCENSHALVNDGSSNCGPSKMNIQSAFIFLMSKTSRVQILFHVLNIW